MPKKKKGAAPSLKNARRRSSANAKSARKAVTLKKASPRKPKTKASATAAFRRTARPKAKRAAPRKAKGARRRPHIKYTSHAKAIAKPAAAPASLCAATCTGPKLTGAKALMGLDLEANAQAAVDKLVEKYGQTVSFISGRRTPAGQGGAMAPHIVNDRQWIKKTYIDVEIANELQGWVDNHPEATTAAQIAAGLGGIITPWDTAKRRRLSWHLTGEAFDMKPVAGQQGADIIAYLKTLPHYNKFLDKEGGDIVWHAQFA